MVVPEVQLIFVNAEPGPLRLVLFQIDALGSVVGAIRQHPL